MKILIGMTRSDTVLSGSYKHICQIGARFKSEGAEVIYVIGGSGIAAQKLRNDGYRVITLKHLKRDFSLFNDIIAQIQLIRIILKEKPNLCSWHTAKIGALGRIASFLTNCDSYYIPHGVPFVNTPENKGYKVYEKLERALAVLPTPIIGVCEFDCNEYKRIGVNEKRLMMIPNGMQVSHEKSSDSKKLSNAPIKFITAARFEKQKDYETLAFACKELARETQNFELHIYGDGPQEIYVRSLFKGISEKHILFKGTVDNFSKELMKADVYILSSHWEGLPRSIIEAMACKRPIIASDVGGVNELIDHEITGYLIQHRNSAGVMSAMKAYISHREKIKEHGDAAYNLYLTKYTLSKMLNTYTENYLNNRKANKNYEREGDLVHED